jgi:hypothetical protein
LAISALVAILAVTTLHPGRRAGVQAPALRGHHRLFRGAGGEDIYPLGAEPTKAQFMANFAVLRRPQDARDRSWRPNCSCGGAARQLFGLTRYARSLPGGIRVFLDVEQFIYPGQLNMAAGSYALNFDLVSPNGNTDSSNFGPNTQYLVFPVASRGPDNTRGGTQNQRMGESHPGRSGHRALDICLLPRRPSALRATHSPHLYGSPVRLGVTHR